MRACHFPEYLTPIFGGGDEIYALNKYFENHAIAWVVGLVIVPTLTIPPVVKVWSISGNKRKIWWFIGLLLIPFVMTGAIVFGILQSLLLENGILTDYWILGSPILVTVWLIFSILTFSVFSGSLLTLLKPISEENSHETNG